MRKRLEDEPVNSEHGATDKPSLEARIELLEARLAHYDEILARFKLEFTDLKQTVQNLTPWVMQGRMRGEMLQVFQLLEERVSVIERYLKMVTAQ